MPPLYWIDAFADDLPFSGNPAGVCLLEKPTDEAWMKGLAGELNLSETAFLHPEKGGFALRWFTPSGTEVKLCGHATLASAEALLDSGQAKASEAIRFETLSGELRAWRRKDNGLIELDFPQSEPLLAVPPAHLLQALGMLAAEGSAKAGEDWLVECADEDEVRGLKPDFAALKAFGGRGICVTARAKNPGEDFVSRFFGPALGIDEDPVTGSAHCYLGPWWAARLGRTELLGRQLSKRGGQVQVSLKNGRAFLSGRAAIVFKGGYF